MSLLEVETVSKRFGSLLAVDKVSMSVDSGELRAVIGPNGAGKTTFFNLISGFVRPDAGRIVLDGHDVTRLLPARRVWRGLARTFQITEVFPRLTVGENLQISVEVAAGFRLRIGLSGPERLRVRERADELLEWSGLRHNVGRAVGELSHGDQRTVEIMMALALNPRLLLLDEPTAGMGERETYEIAQLIGRLHREKKLAIVLIEHDMRLVLRMADRVMVLDRGSVLADGAPAEIVADEAVQAAYLGKAVA
jgi:branched-chain amino acid transport system ATP-binding protein